MGSGVAGTGQSSAWQKRKPDSDHQIAGLVYRRFNPRSADINFFKVSSKSPSTLAGYPKFERRLMWPREAKDGQIVCLDMLLTKYGAVASSAELISSCCYGRLVRISLSRNVDKKMLIIICILLLQLFPAMESRYDRRGEFNIKSGRKVTWTHHPGPGVVASAEFQETYCIVYCIVPRRLAYPLRH